MSLNRPSAFSPTNSYYYFNSEAPIKRRSFVAFLFVDSILLNCSRYSYAATADYCVEPASKCRANDFSLLNLKSSLFTDRPTCTIRMSNNSREYVAFKVMALDPNRFMASTSLGKMNPGSYREIEVTMRGQVGDLPNMLHGDRIGIESLVVNPDDTIERIRTLFNTQRHRVDVFKLRVAHVHHQGRNLNYIQQPGRNRRRGVIVVFSFLIFWYLMMQSLSRVWYPSTPCIYISKVVTSMLMKIRMISFWKCSSTMMISAITFLVLMIMMRNTAVEAVGEWIIIRRTVLHLILYFLDTIREKLFQLFTRWLDVGFSAFVNLFRFVFGQPQRRQPRYRN